MGDTKKLGKYLLFLSAIALAVQMGQAYAAPNAWEKIRSEILRLDVETQTSKFRHLSAKRRIQKLSKLMQLQKKEIKLYEKRVTELKTTTESLEVQKRALSDKVAAVKQDVYRDLSLLHHWVELTKRVRSENKISLLEAELQRKVLLSRIANRGVNQLSKLRLDEKNLENLSLRIEKEKSRLQYYVQDLREKIELLKADQKHQKNIAKLSHNLHVKSMERLKEFKRAERELESMVDHFSKKNDLEADDFMDLKGKLRFPVVGSVLSHYGRFIDPQTKIVTFRKGITIGAENSSKLYSSKVYSVAAGKVVYSGNLKNYGQVVIVEHRGKYYSLYAQLSQTNVQVNQHVSSGYALGALEKDPLYFEIREKNVAVNPLEWLQQVKLVENRERT
ncbi:MAG: murein hydrolase activator EnvC [Bacteriovoracia bacterium]